MFLEDLGGHVASLDDLQYILDSVGGISALAASLTLEVAPAQAWEAWAVQEKGRGGIINTYIGRRNDLEELRKQNYEVYCQYMDLRRRMYGAMSHSSSSGLDLPMNNAGNDALHGIMKHRADKAMLTQIETEWAVLPSIQSYGQHQLQNLAKLGSIVAFNATHLRTDAFIATSTSIEVLKLDGVKYKKLEEYAKLLAGPHGKPFAQFFRGSIFSRQVQWAICRESVS
ncbi:hypothetical protein ARSEF1564_005236 [Beauveria bassiana]